MKPQNSFCSLWVLYLQCGHSNREEIVLSQRFKKKTILKVFFFGKRTNKIIRFNYVTETLKPFELSWQLRKQPSNLWVIGLSAKLENLLFSENIVIGQSSFECPLCKWLVLPFDTQFAYAFKSIISNIYIFHSAVQNALYWAIVASDKYK